VDEKYLNYLADLDKILFGIKDNPNIIPMSFELVNIQHPTMDKDSERYFSDKLETDGYVKAYTDTGGTSICITPKGRDFISLGGYIGQIKDQSEKEKLETDLKTSTIKANKTNIKYFRWNIGLAVLNFIILIVNLIIGYFNLLKH
jgi:hypothetical protein